LPKAISEVYPEVSDAVLLGRYFTGGIGKSNFMSKEIKDLTKKIIEFRDARDWKQFHKPKDLAISLLIEASEVLEHFQWKSEAEIEEYVKKYKNEIAEELADVFNYLLLMAHDLGIDLIEAERNKIEKSEKKYPIEKAKGKHTKYNKL
jgi:NTP pyrophosphatase (non-canonical NTP hydrolase)